MIVIKGHTKPCAQDRGANQPRDYSHVWLHITSKYHVSSYCIISLLASTHRSLNAKTCNAIGMQTYHARPRSPSAHTFQEALDPQPPKSSRNSDLTHDLPLSRRKRVHNHCPIDDIYGTPTLPTTSPRFSPLPLLPDTDLI